MTQLNCHKPWVEKKKINKSYTWNGLSPRIEFTQDIKKNGLDGFEKHAYHQNRNSGRIKKNKGRLIKLCLLLILTI